MKLPDLDDRFEEFWRAYPRRVGKGDARKVWAKLKPSTALLDLMLAAIAWQSETRQWTMEGGRFCPHPGTWLRQERWLDDPPHQPARPQVYWWDECKEIHGGACEKSAHHYLRKQREAGQ